MAKKKIARVEFQLDPATKKKLKKKAKKEGVLMSKFIRDLITKNLSQAA